MSFLGRWQVHELVKYARMADAEVRSDLVQGFIRDEDDYTSNFTAALRRNINTYSTTGLKAQSFLLPTNMERATGTDAAIILQRGDRMKIALFEAKWPRFEVPGYRWDYSVTAGNHSHFSDQLTRQAAAAQFAAVFEMFYNGHAFGAEPSHLLPRNSSCVWHADAIACRNARNDPHAVWSQQELEDLVKPHRHDVGDMLREVGRCKAGKAFEAVKPERLAREMSLQGPVLAVEAALHRKRLA